MFKDRKEAGRQLAEKLKDFRDSSETVIVALPRGGVIVGKEVAQVLRLPLTALPVKKLRAPANSELAIGAISINKVKYLNFELIKALSVSDDFLSSEISEKEKQVGEQALIFRTDIDYLTSFRYYIIIDDGIATGSTVLAAVKLLRNGLKDKKKIIVAVPVIARDIFEVLQNEVDRLETMVVSSDFKAVGQFYRNFKQVSDKEVIHSLRKGEEN
ncbi:MAG: phosphoribosyltransferase [Candidatus Gottesmanbacteria bacterium GW2011_GWA2_43_14]|uniref:Phosphoribosyltransferase n=1 Tax=Candidatus Gottesmanbacteria bacterium GW2011_GWA2_43_14 TaxID=1618443 RepID=A0A0G1FSH9_9BACT|nr:MAG: phosphoribosyltransferase [Candidatus Gottesmanbacteria bacterium GW2011_GWA2_43_14]